jgi:hypothetical protein
LRRQFGDPVNERRDQRLLGPFTDMRGSERIDIPVTTIFLMMISWPGTLGYWVGKNDDHSLRAVWMSE